MILSQGGGKHRFIVYHHDNSDILINSNLLEHFDDRDRAVQVKCRSGFICQNDLRFVGQCPDYGVMIILSA